MALSKCDASQDPLFPICSRTTCSPSLAKPSKVVVHVGTNDASTSGATADKIIDAFLELKKEFETKLPESTVVISTPLKGNDKVYAGKIIETLNKKIRGLGFNIVDNNNIDSEENYNK